jgi:hypothetical protein
MNPEERKAVFDVLHALEPVFYKVSNLKYETYCYETVHDKSIWFSLTFKPNFTVHIEVHVDDPSQIGQKVFYTLYEDKVMMSNGMGALDAVIIDIKDSLDHFTLLRTERRDMV